MTSLDSIGSCSLDVYASSSEDTDSFSGATKYLPEHCKRHGHEHLKTEEHDDLASACTLCSVSGLCYPASVPSNTVSSKTESATTESPEYVRRTARLFEETDKEQHKEDETNSTNIPTFKKPSYLGLACSLSGYSGLTSYDSKLREGFRTRDKSPAPPPPRPLTTTNMPQNTLSKVNGVRSDSSKNEIKSVTPSSHVNGNMSEERSSISGPSTSRERESRLRESSRKFMTSMLSDEADFSNGSRMLQVHPRGPSASTPDDPLCSSGSTCNTLKRSPGTVRIVEFTSQTKSYVSVLTSTSSRSSLQTASAKESWQYSSEVSVGHLNGSEKNKEDTPRSATTRIESESAVPSGYCTPKSFVQQRIERLYGPGALAQGFFSRTRQLSVSEEESVPQSVETCSNTSAGSPALPVLRHLRPEFRAQLPLTSPRSPRHTPREITSSFESQPSPVLQQQTSVESISDSQPAAPEVPILIGDNIPVINSIMANEELKSSSFCKDSRSNMNSETPVHKLIKDSMENCVTPEDKSQIPQNLEDLSINVIGDEEKDGNYYLKVLRCEIQRLNKLVESTEEELSSQEKKPEEALGKLRAASGQARLLMKQKLQQFEGLCHKNINQSPEEVFPTTNQDLAGFWDMVKLQIDHVDRLFAEIDSLKKAGWIERAGDSTASSSGSGVGSRHKASSRRNAAGSSSGKSKYNDEQRKGSEGFHKKEELALARRKMMEEKRKIMKQQQQAKQENVEIYVPRETGK